MGEGAGSVTYSDDFGHLFGFDRPIAIHIIHLKRPFQLLLRFSSGSDVDGQQKFFEVDLSAVVRVESAKHVLTELVGVALREETRVNLEELGPRQLAARTIPLRSYTCGKSRSYSALNQ